MTTTMAGPFLAVARASPSAALVILPRTLGCWSPRGTMVACRRLCFRISPGQTWFTTDRGARTSVRRASRSSMWLMATFVFPQPISRASIAPGLSRMNSRAFTWCAHGLGGWAVVVISCLLAFCFLRKSSWRCVESSLPGCYNKSRDLPTRWSPASCPFCRCSRWNGLFFFHLTFPWRGRRRACSRWRRRPRAPAGLMLGAVGSSGLFPFWLRGRSVWVWSSPSCVTRAQLL